MKTNVKHFGQLLVVLCCLALNVEANKKLRKILLASLISKSLKSHMNHQSLVPVVMPPLNHHHQDHHQDQHHDDYHGKHHQDHHHDQHHHDDYGKHHESVGHHQAHVQAHVPTITVHHYHHHTTSHHLIDDDPYHGYDGYDNHIDHLDTGLHHHSDYQYGSPQTYGSSKGKAIHIGSGGGSLLSGSLGGNVGNLLGGHITGQIG